MYYELSYKQYELTDHLGSVCTVVKDVKYAALSPQGSVTGPYRLSVDQVNDYYPFGRLLCGRSASASDASYRFLFNNQTQDSEITGYEGTFYSSKYRSYDSRIARFWSVDPLASSYPWNSTYAFAKNRVIDRSAARLRGSSYGR